MHTRTILDRQLSEMNTDIIRLSSMVQTSLQQAMDALYDRDTPLAEEVIAADEEINAVRYEVEQDALLILARQQPAASDLRTVVAAIHLATELERIGDHASGIARLVRRMQGEPEIDSLYKLPKMAKRALKMVDTAVQAYIERDTEMAESVLDRDAKIDKHYRKLFRETLEEMRDEDYLRRSTYLLWVGHNLERVGDRAINIAERVIFMTTGVFVEDEVTFD
ncbi:MAG: phosphate signaling complex protein PhoU [Candidatus Promineifilaceae bacterium]|nr:phosphate signaling complex protein PhoU [Candidatus Promineifilaceae bacterium]